MSKIFSLSTYYQPVSIKTAVMCMDLNHTSRLYGYICITLPLIPFSPFNLNKVKKVEDIGVEPMTPCVQGRCSSQLS